MKPPTLSHRLNQVLISGCVQENDPGVIQDAMDVIEEMRTALQEIEWLFDGKEDITDNGGPNDAMKALAAARAAIAKATP